MSQYTYWKDVTKLIKAKEANIQRTLAGKQKAIQAAAANFQQNIQANKYDTGTGTADSGKYPEAGSGC